MERPWTADTGQSLFHYASLIWLCGRGFLLFSKLDVDDGTRDSLLLDTPAATICIPIISRAIAIMRPANTAPKTGAANIIIDIITAKTPTPMVKPLTHPLLALFVTPSTIPASPSIISANG
jgi:hypothetical protein